MTAPAAVPHLPHTVRAGIEFARTHDGWDIALHHYPGTPATPGAPPLILCPGYACNRVFMDADDRYSLARFLARRGFDTWVLELRGHGHSEPAGAGSTDWTFDDLVHFDVPAAVRAVSAWSGRRPVWVGHSMGGIVMYAALGTEATPPDAIAGLVTLASPVVFPPVSSLFLRGVGQLLAALPLPRVPQRGALIGLWSALRLSPGMLDVGMNPTNTDLDAFGAALRRGICNVPRGLLRQLAGWSLSGELRSCDRRVDYRAALSRITTPALVVAGTADRLAPPEFVRFAHDRISSTHKEYLEFGVQQGASADYGHVDLIFGRRAPEEVFPAVARWIEDVPESR